MESLTLCDPLISLDAVLEGKALGEGLYIGLVPLSNLVVAEDADFVEATFDDPGDPFDSREIVDGAGWPTVNFSEARVVEKQFVVRERFGERYGVLDRL